MKQAWKIRGARIAGWLLAAATLLVAALLAFQCAEIYRVGTSAENLTAAGVRIHDVYSRELVGERLGRISWAFVVWAALCALALIARAIAPALEKAKPELSPESRLERARLRAEPTPEMRAQRRARRNASLLCAAVCAVCAGAVGAYFLDSSRFASRDLETVMGAMLLNVAPWVLVAFAALALLTWGNGRSRLRELEAIKAAPRRSPEPLGARGPGLPIARIALYVAAVLLIVAGVVNGGMYDVLVKAINICTECIGLG